MLYGYADAARETARFNVEAMLPWISGTPPCCQPSRPPASPSRCTTPTTSPARTARRWPTPPTTWASSSSATAPIIRTASPARRPRLPGRLERHQRRIAYHQPCHLKAQQIGSPGLDLLREIPGLEVVDLAAGCCGMAGTFGMKRDTYDLSMQTGRAALRARGGGRARLRGQRVQHLPAADSRGDLGRRPSIRSRCWPRPTGYSRLSRARRPAQPAQRRLLVASRASRLSPSSRAGSPR